MWILDNQLARRNINSFTRNDLIGRRYLVEKNTKGGDRKSIHQNDVLNFDSTAKILASKVGVGSATVERAAKLSQAIDTVTANTGISRATILSKKINCTQDDIIDLAKLEKAMQIEVISQVTSKGLDVGTAIRIAEREEHHRQAAEAEEKRLQMEAQLKAKREEEAAQERENLRIAHEERLKQEAKDAVEKAFLKKAAGKQ